MPTPLGLDTIIYLKWMSDTMAYRAKWYDDKEMLRLLYIKQGKDMDKIAAQLGVSHETVRKLLIKHNLKRGKS